MHVQTRVCMYRRHPHHQWIEYTSDLLVTASPQHPLQAHTKGQVGAIVPQPLHEVQAAQGLVRPHISPPVWGKGEGILPRMAVSMQEIRADEEGGACITHWYGWTSDHHASKQQAVCAIMHAVRRAYGTVSQRGHTARRCRLDRQADAAYQPPAKGKARTLHHR